MILSRPKGSLVFHNIAVLFKEISVRTIYNLGDARASARHVNG